MEKKKKFYKFVGLSKAKPVIRATSLEEAKEIAGLRKTTVKPILKVKKLKKKRKRRAIK